MAEQVVVAPLLIALATAVFTLLSRRYRRLQRALSLAGVLGYAVAVAALVAAVTGGTGAGTRVLTYQVGRWPAPLGITLVADALAAFMLALAAVVVVVALAFSVRYVDDYGQRLSYHPLFHFMLAGVTGSFLTGDLFNLFVWFEVMLMASYVLVVFYSGPEHTSAALQYVLLNLLGSAVMLLSIGGLYATLGTLNMADMARRLAAADPGTAAPVLGLSALLFAVFALKAGIVPFQFWVPAAYRAAPTPVTAVLAGVVKKVGIYAIVRLYFTVFGAAAIPVGLPGLAGDSVLAFYGPVLFVMGTASVVLGGVGAVGREDVEGLLAYSSISQVGFIVLPLAVAAWAVTVGAAEALQVLALAAALVYALNHALAKSMLFLVAGVVEDATGTDRFRELGGLATCSPALAAAFFVGALALIGIPPLAGFFGKLLVFDAAARARSAGVLAVALVGALFTVAYFSLSWNRGFWGAQSIRVERASVDGVQVGVVMVLALAVVGVGVGFDPVYRFAEAGARAALAREEYVRAVVGGSA